MKIRLQGIGGAAAVLTDAESCTTLVDDLLEPWFDFLTASTEDSAADAGVKTRRISGG